MILLAFIRWHYGDGLRRVLQNTVLRVRGFLNYFSVLELSRTLFSPWHRIIESRGSTFDPMRLITGAIMNIFSRVTGAIVRIVVIVVGLVMSTASALFGIAAIASWLVAPFAIPVLLVLGLMIAFT